MRDRDYYPAGAFNDQIDTPQCEEDEIWKPCPDFETKYLISNYGRIRSIGTCNSCKKNGLIKQFKKNGRNGYMQVRLHDHPKAKTIEVHILVAKAFIDNPNGLPMINHKDEDKTNNYYKNLEWCDNSYNIRYSKAKAIDVYTKEGAFVETLDAIVDASKKYDIPTSNISRCCKSRYGITNGYQFRYAGQPFQKRPLVFTEYQRRKSRRGHSSCEGRFVPINVYTTKGELVKSYENLSQAAKDYNTSTSNICKCYKGEILTNKGVIFLADNSIKERLNLLNKRRHKSKSELC